MVADTWQHLVCVFTQDDANNFELGNDGTNYGDIKLKDVRVYDRAWSASEAKSEYNRTKKFY